MRAIRSIGASAATLLLLTAPAIAQNEKQPDPVKIVVESQDPVKIDYGWELRPRTPVQFTPFEMVDPNTGRPVRPDDMISIGSLRMRAGDYYRQLNEMERWLNERGYSLRTDSTFNYYSPLLESEIAESEKHLKELEARMPLPGEDSGSSLGDFNPASCNSLGRSFETGWLGNSNFGLRLRGNGSFVYCWYPTFSNTVGLQCEGNAVLEGKLANSVMEIANARATGSIGTRDPRLSDFQYNYAISVQVLGNTVWAPSGQGNINARYERNWDWLIAQLNWNSGNIPLGGFTVLGVPIVVFGKLGISGELRLAAGVDLTIALQSVYAKPYGNLTGYAEAWLGAHIGIAHAGVGVRGNVNFLQGGVRAEARGGLNAYGSNPTCYEYGFGAYLIAEIDQALSGNIELFARGCIRLFRQWRCAEGSWNLYSWNGFSWPNTEIGRWAIAGLHLGCL